MTPPPGSLRPPAREFIRNEGRVEEAQVRVEEAGLGQVALSGETALTSIGASVVTAGTLELASLGRQPSLGQPLSVPPAFREARDFMTGGNGGHNGEARWATDRVLRRLEEAGVCADPRQVQREVHAEVRHYKDNGLGQRNGNVPSEAWEEIIDHVAGRYLGRASSAANETTGNSTVHNWIDRHLEERFVRLNNEGLRLQLRTELRALFQRALANWGADDLGDIEEYFRHGVVGDFEAEASAYVEARIDSLSTDLVQ